MNSTTFLLILVAFFVLYMFFISKKQKDAYEEMERRINALKQGDFVRTNSGIVGEIVSINEEPYGKMAIISTGKDAKSEIEIDIRFIVDKIDLDALKEALKQNEETTETPVEENETTEDTKTEQSTETETQVEENGEQKDGNENPQE